MFHSQSEDRDKNLLLKYPETYKKWKKDNNLEDRRLKANMYMDKEFFQFIVEAYINDGSYKVEFCELIDLLTRKNMTSSLFIGYYDQHDDMYSLAVQKCIIDAPRSYDKDIQSAFVYFTSTVRNSFFEILKNFYKTKEIALKILKSELYEAIAYNVDKEYIAEIDREIHKAIDFAEEEEVIQMYENRTQFFDTLRENFTVKNVRLLENKNAPKYKRKYEHFQGLIPVKTKGVIIDYFDLTNTNEAMGTRPGYIQFRSRVARLNGYQYLAVFSDIWESDPSIYMDRIEHLMTYIEMNHPVMEFGDSYGYDLGSSYIPFSHYDDTNLTKPKWYGLKDDRKVRYPIIDQDVQKYINWLDTNENATRVYDCGRLDIKLSDESYQLYGKSVKD